MQEVLSTHVLTSRWCAMVCSVTSVHPSQLFFVQTQLHLRSESTFPGVTRRGCPDSHEDNEDMSTYITIYLCSDQEIFYLSLPLGGQINAYQEMTHEFLGAVTFFYNFSMHLCVSSHRSHIHMHVFSSWVKSFYSSARLPTC